MGADAQLDVGTDQLLCRSKIHQTFAVGRDAYDLCAKLHKRTHDRVVLQGTDQYDVSLLDKALDDLIESRRQPTREQYALGLVKMKQAAQAFPHGQYGQLRLACALIAPAADVCPDFLYVMKGRLRNGGRFGKGGRGIIKINRHFYVILTCI